MCWTVLSWAAVSTAPPWTTPPTPTPQGLAADFSLWILHIQNYYTYLYVCCLRYLLSKKSAVSPLVFRVNWYIYDRISSKVEMKWFSVSFYLQWQCLEVFNLLFFFKQLTLILSLLRYSTRKQPYRIFSILHFGESDYLYSLHTHREKIKNKPHRFQWTR